MIGSADLLDGLYYISFTEKEVNAYTASDTHHPNIPAKAIWHFRLGHVSINRMLLLKNMFPFITVDNNGVCDVCHFSRQRKLPYNVSTNKAHVPFELIHFDIWGPIATKSIHNHVFFLTVVDDYSRFTWITLMKHKSETRQHVIDFIKMIEVQHKSHVKIVRSDNGVEFLMPQFYSSKGILHQTSCVETPEQNGRVERKHQHLVNVGRALLFQANLPKIFWSYAVQHATYIINRIPSTVLKNKSPYELLHNEKPQLDHLKVFGSLVYAFTILAHRTKLDPRCRKCIFLGYKTGVKGVILYDLNSKEIFLSRNVTHHDHILPYKSSSATINWQYHTDMFSDTTPIIDIPSPITDSSSPNIQNPSPSPNSTN
jgi:hypothetical protein